MLNKLPQEILAYVTQFLTFNDKLNLVTTCRYLHDAILKLTLYENITICYKKGKTEEIFKKFETSELNGSQVRHIVVDLDSLPDALLIKLSTLFPCVTQLETFFGPKKMRPPSVLNTFLKWKDTIQIFNLNKAFFQMGHLLENNAFPRLRTLCLSPYSHSMLPRTRIPNLQVMECIKNAPALTTLILFNADIDLEMLEEIHDICPNLKNLEMSSVSVTTTNDDDIMTILKPATSVTTFKLDSDTNLSDKNCLLLDYIITKYPNLIVLSFLCNFSEDISEKFFMSLNYDKLDEDSNQYLPCNEKRDDDVQTTLSVYLDEGEKFLPRLPKSIKELSLTSNVFIDTIDLLCEAELQLTKLTLSTPVGFYSSMTLLDGFINEESYNTCDDPSMIEFLETMTGLTSLNTTFNPKILKNRIISVSVTTLDLTLTKVRSRQAQSIDMDRILIAFPSLMSLNLSYPNTIVTANPDNDDIQSHPSLRHVELQCESIDTSATRLLGRVAPNLKTMKWIVTARRGGKAQIKFIMENKRSKDLEYTIDITALKLEAFDFAYNNYHGDHIYRSRLCLEAHKLEGKRQQYVYAMSFGGVLTPISNDPEDSDDNFDGEDFINLMPKVKVLYDSIGVLRFQGHELS